MKRTVSASAICAALLCGLLLSGCQKNASEGGKHDIVLGFSQIGAESEW